MSFSTKLERLHLEKLQLIEKRIFEIAKLAEKAEVLALDNDVILGALLYAKEVTETKKSDIINDFVKRARKIPSRRKSILKKNKDSNNATV